MGLIVNMAQVIKFGEGMGHALAYSYLPMYQDVTIGTPRSVRRETLCVQAHLKQFFWQVTHL